LEVSGLRKGNESDIKSRLKRKKEQTKRSDGVLLPAYIVIIEFGKPQSQVAKR
jgi:hypothetical protein